MDIGLPVLVRGLEQHARYCEALQRCGLALDMAGFARMDGGSGCLSLRF